MRPIERQTLFLIAAVTLSACSGESDCSRTATCPSSSDAGPPSDVTALPVPSDVASERASFDGGPLSAQDEGGGESPMGPVDSEAATADETPPEPQGEPVRDVADGGPPGTLAVDSGAGPWESPSDSATSEPPIVVVGFPESDGGSDEPSSDTATADESVDAGSDAGRGCALGTSRPCEGALGACAAGLETCDETGEFGPCSVQPELVDSCWEAGDDANCDGLPNDGCECVTGNERACGPELEQGICAWGTSICDDGVWGPCEGAIMPEPRQCASSDDNDCDGQPDETLDGVCQCAPGETRACDTHPGLDGVGPCEAGVSECVVSDDGASAEWGECVGAVGPRAGDACNVVGDDSNCNGIANQGCDFTPPSVVTSLPAKGQTGVTADQEIVISFSEPMDRASTENAIGFSWDADVSFVWNAASTVLTITPGALDYAEGAFEDLASLPAEEYSVTVGGDALDLAGNALLAPFAVAFTTLRRIQHTLPLAGPNGAYGIAWVAQTLAGISLCQNDRAGVGYRPAYSLIIASFDTSVLPQGIVAFETASLIAHQAAAQGDLIDFSGPVRVEHISVTPGEENGNGIWAVDAPALRNLGTLTNDLGVGERSVDVVSALAEDYAMRMDRDEQSEYRILTSHIIPGPDTPKYIDFTCSAFAIATTYLVP